MRNINDVMPKMSGMRWGAVLNFKPTHAQLLKINKMLPHDRCWHEIFETPGEMFIDGISVRRRSMDSMT